MNTPSQHDALLLLSFGGPEGPEEVLPFLENVLRGRNVPRERLLEVAEHYQHFGGKSPINDQNRALIEALRTELNAHGCSLPIYWGNRNWNPLLADTFAEMAAKGVRRALAFVTSAFGSYSGCRQYLEDIQRARAKVGPAAPQVDKLRGFFNHPGFIEAMTDRVRSVLAEAPAASHSAVPLLFTAHSIPLAMAETCRYEAELHEACRLVGERLGRTDWRLVFQSRSGPPSQPWLAPDVNEALRKIAAELGKTPVVLVPIGFISDHIEVVYDLDTEARATCQELGLSYFRAATVGVHPRFVTMIRQLVEERTGTDSAMRDACGGMPPCPDACPADCCAYSPRRA